MTSGAWRPSVASVEGRFLDASNATLLATTDDGTKVVYKPVAGQRPLWDFDAATLPLREVLTYETSRRMGYDLVPETVMIDDGPFGPGCVQRFVEADPTFDAASLVRAGDHRLWRVASLDVVTNNADRKLGHVLSVGGRIVAIDHGLTFHEGDKLRTVLWSFADLPWPAEIGDAFWALARSIDEAPEPYLSWLDHHEFHALRQRIEEARETGVHPSPPDDRPAVPWPPY
jgi:hypothetical protein